MTTVADQNPDPNGQMPRRGRTVPGTNAGSFAAHARGEAALTLNTAKPEHATSADASRSGWAQDEDPTDPTTWRPVGRDAEVHLTVSAVIAHTSTGKRRFISITDAYHPPATTCRLPGHLPAKTPRKHVEEHGDRLDCACDVACPRCAAKPGQMCATVDGGGMSGGGFTVSPHAARTKVSARCQALLTGEVTRCDLGDHDWKIVGEPAEGSEVGADAECRGCGRRETLHSTREAFGWHLRGRYTRRLPQHQAAFRPQPRPGD